MEVCRLEVLLQYMKRDINKLILLFNGQYDFREKRSTSSAISTLMEQLYSNFDESKITQGIFLDFSEALYTIDHEILIKKLPFYHFTNDACLLLKSYLSNRKQYVKTNNF